MSRFRAASLTVLLAWPGELAAQPVVADIDATRSTVTAELCVLLVCDDDTSRVDGTLEVELDDYADPTEIRLHDFFLDLVDDMHLRPNIPFIFSVDVLVSGATARDPDPTVPGAWVPVDPSGDFVFAGESALLTGIADYDVTGTACAPLMSAGLPCTGTVNLADLPQTPIALPGNLQIAGGVLTLRFDFAFDQPLEGLGNLAADGVVIATAPIPACDPVSSIATGLMVAREGADGLAFSWDENAEAQGGYRVYDVASTADLPLRGSNPAAALTCESGDRADLDCLDAAGVSGSGPLVFYQVVVVCSDGSEGPN